MFSSYGYGHTVLVIFGGLLANALTGLAALKYAESKNAKRKQKKDLMSNEICETRGCIRESCNILDKMDQSVNPCDNFYQFACGRYVKEVIIPNEKSRNTVFSSNRNKLERRLRKSINKEITVNDPETFKLLKCYYNTCMDTDQIEKTSEEDFREILKDLGGWPVVEGDLWNEPNFDWINSTYKLRKIGFPYNIFIGFSVSVDSKNSSRRLIHIDQASTGISRVYLLKGLDEKVVKAYYKYMVDLAVIFGANRQQAESELIESLNFEIELAKLSLPKEQRRDVKKLYNLMTVHELESKYPIVPWTEYFNQLLAPYTEVQGNEEVVVRVPSYLEAFCDLISRTPKRVLANYAIWRAILQSAGLLNNRIQHAEFEFHSSISGVKVAKSRRRKCFSFALNYLNLAMSALYVRRHFDEKAKANAVGIMEDIRSSFRNLLIQIDWMDEKTKTAALEKLDYMKPYVAYPDEFMDNEKIDEYHRSLKIDPKSFLKSQLNVNLFHIDRSFDLLRQPVNKTDWTTHGKSAVVNAFYRTTDNSIQFPAGILQGEFFSNDRPNYLNFGSIGVVMGHEMTHGFDDKGRQFDKEGNLFDWWDSETKKKYLEKAQCIIDQYSNYTCKQVGLNLNGKKTQGENIADNGGMKQAYYAYNEWEKRNGQEPRLPGLPYTSQQMFWIGAANVWCEKHRSEEMRRRVLTGVHSPGEFRINGSMSNMPEFSRDFKCPEDSPMNPARKCSVW